MQFILDVTWFLQTLSSGTMIASQSNLSTLLYGHPCCTLRSQVRSILIKRFSASGAPK